ncbi:MAG: NAD-dependent succinate-semialdehyde dehydrogenase [Stagnimonas sp.]|nr:NAD-dependent succinate-semialdehyde dehydrogenase [Stagnimonas sp.]
MTVEATWSKKVNEASAHVRAAGLLEKSSWIGGVWISSQDLRPVTDPATGLPFAEAAWMTPEHVDTAVEHALHAQKKWSKVLARQRGDGLRSWAAVCREHAHEIAQVITLEQGKPLREALDEVRYGIGFMDWFAAEAERAYGETIPAHKPGVCLTVDLQPVGVVGIVTPWNFPFAMIARKAAAALAAGCSVVVKPAPETPLSAFALARMAQKANLPPGIFNVVHGDGPELVRRLNEHVQVRALSFTGSTEVGRVLMRDAAATVKRVSLELGGHAPFIVFDDAPLEKAVDDCMAAKFATSGQDCLAVNRVYVQQRSYAAFCDALAGKVRELRVGHGLEEATQIGPMTRRSVAEKCRTQVEDAIDRGGRLLAGNNQASLSGGNFITPTLIVDANESMDIARDETFGPVVAVLPFDTEDEAVVRANNNELGLAAYVQTESLGRAHRVSKALEYGMVAVNTPSFTGAPIPFGGWKQAGLGREGSRHGMAEFMELKYTCIQTQMQES